VLLRFEKIEERLANFAAGHIRAAGINQQARCSKHPSPCPPLFRGEGEEPACGSGENKGCGAGMPMGKRIENIERSNTEQGQEEM
jgi:hypothetical protein